MVNVLNDVGITTSTKIKLIYNIQNMYKLYFTSYFYKIKLDLKFIFNL